MTWLNREHRVSGIELIGLLTALHNAKAFLLSEAA